MNDQLLARVWPQGKLRAWVEKKPADALTARLYIENMAFQSYDQEPKLFLNEISIILSKPLYTLAGVLLMSPVAVRLKKYTL